MPVKVAKNRENLPKQATMSTEKLPSYLLQALLRLTFVNCAKQRKDCYAIIA